MSEGHILVVDDEADIRRLIQEILVDEDYTVSTAEDAAHAREQFKTQQLDLILLDIWMPDTDGISLLKEWAGNGGLKVPVIMMSGHGNIETAVEATRVGAYDFIEKPVSMGKLLITIDRAIQSHKLQQENLRLREDLVYKANLVGKSMVMKKLCEDLEQIAAHETCVLITGEAGSGKSVAAHYLHHHSNRSTGPLIEANLGATTETEAAVRLFGRENGETSPGYLEQAAGGTLILEEVADLGQDTQHRLLMAMNEKRFVRIGDNKPIDLTARIVATSSQDIDKAVSDGRFREDFYFYLNVVPVHMPALRDHREDVPDLVNFYLDLFVDKEHLPYRKFSIGSLNTLRNHSWPGNIRELKNIVQRLLILNRDADISSEEVDQAISSQPSMPVSYPESLFTKSLRSARDQFEKAYLEFHLGKTHGNVTEVAKIAEVERTHLYRKLKSLGINPKQS